MAKKKKNPNLERTPEDTERCGRIVDDCTAQVAADIARIRFGTPEDVHCFLDNFFGGLRRRVEEGAAGQIMASIIEASGIPDLPPGVSGEVTVIPLGTLTNEQAEEMKGLAEGVESAAPEDKEKAMENFMEWVAGQKKQAEKGDRFRDN